jgi:hypothetical protein
MSAAARAEAERRFPDVGQGREAFVVGAEWADAQREPVTAATRDHLVTIIHTSGQSLTITESAAVTNAILAEFRAVVSTRERLAEVRIPSPIARDVNLPLGVDGADAVLASGAVEDRDEVEGAAEDIGYANAVEDLAQERAKVAAGALGSAATDVERPTWHPLGRLNDTEHRTMHLIREWLVARAQGIREGRS